MPGQENPCKVVSGTIMLTFQSNEANCGKYSFLTISTERIKILQIFSNVSLCRLHLITISNIGTKLTMKKRKF